MEVMSRKATQAVNFFPSLTKASKGLLLRKMSCFLTEGAGLTRNFSPLEQLTSLNLRDQSRIRLGIWMQ